MKRGSRELGDGPGAAEGHGQVEMFASLTEEPSAMTAGDGEATERVEEPGFSEESASGARSDHDRIARISKDKRVYSSGYIPPPKVGICAGARLAC